MLNLTNLSDLSVTLICFLVMLIVQLKIIRTLRSHTSLIMFYGKQIEDMRKSMASGGGVARRLPEVSPDDHGLYEVLND